MSIKSLNFQIVDYLCTTCMLRMLIIKHNLLIHSKTSQS